MARFSANLGLLWTELSLPDAIRAAASAGFDAVECHWPTGTPADEVRSALSDAGLPMLCLNTAPGDILAGEFGLGALPGRAVEANEALEAAIDYARAIGCAHVHVMAGKASGERAQACFVEHLQRASRLADEAGVSLLVEPLNRVDVPGYLLNSLAQAETMLARVDRANIRLMFDCYHVSREEGELLTHLATWWDRVGHIQFAGVPERGPPDVGSFDLGALINWIDARDPTRFMGAEYRPGGPTEATLGWLSEARNP